MSSLSRKLPKDSKFWMKRRTRRCRLFWISHKSSLFGKDSLMKPLRTAILGCGGFANRHASNLITLPEEIELTTFCDHHESNAREFSEKYGHGKGIVFTDHHEMFEKANLDLVIICLPPYAHVD